MNRIISNLTAFMFGLIFAAMLAIASLPRAHGAEPAAQTYIGVIVAYDENGQVVAAQAMGHAGSQSDCMKGIQAAMLELQPKPGITLAALCTAAPPAPTHAVPQSKMPLPGAKRQDTVRL
jgi:hypothetical protein